MPATRDINLFPQQRLTHTPFGKFLQWALTYGRYIIIGTEIVVLLAFISRFKYDRDLNDLREEIAQKQAIVETNNDFEREFRMLQNRVNQVKALTADQRKLLNLLLDIEKLTPADIFFSSISLTEHTVIFKVHARTPAGLALLINNIRLSPIFTEVTIDTIQRQPGETIFNLSAKIVK